MARKIATLDYETDPFKKGRPPKPFCAGIYTGDDYYEFWGDDCVEQVALFLFDKEWLVYAHNGGRFDYHFMLDYIGDWDKVTIIAGRLAKFKIGLCEFRDSINLLPIALDQYQKTKISYDKFEREVREIHKAEILAYLYDDCKFLHELVTKFISEYGLYITQASAAIKYWQKQSGIKAPSSDQQYYEDFKGYYYGGRVECFRKGIIKGKFKSVDINSAYPFAMLSEHPLGLGYFTLENPELEILEQIDDLTTAFFEVKAVSYGCLPFRKENGGLFFPIDDEVRSYKVTGHEIKAGLDTNTLEIKSIQSVICHDELTNFSEYVNHFYELRNEAKKSGDKGLNIICKIFMNALYGKFAANPENYNEYMIANESGLEWAKEELGFNFCGMLGNNYLTRRPLDEDEAHYYNIATAASITGYVRAYLFRAIHSSKNVVYCDTDCIVCEELGENVSLGPKLGQWEIEGHYTSVAIGGKKLYSFKYDKKHPENKGIRKHYKTASKGAQLTYRQIYKVAEGKTVTYYAKSPTYSVYKEPVFLSREIRMLND